jgi:low affinity Fe/Cu permease
MVKATFTISGSDFNADIFEQIKAFINGKGQNFEVSINVKTKETREEMRERIEKSMEDVEKGINLIHFTGEEYEDLVKNLVK